VALYRTQAITRAQENAAASVLFSRHRLSPRARRPAPPRGGVWPRRCTARRRSHERRRTPRHPSCSRQIACLHARDAARTNDDAPLRRCGTGRL